MRPADRPTFKPTALDAVCDYLVAAASAKTVLQSLYAGISVLSIDTELGTGVVCAGENHVRVPLGAFNDARPQTGSPICKAEALALGRLVCQKVGHIVCLDFLWCRRGLPIFGELYTAARQDMLAPVGCWVLNHALSILQTAAHSVARASFNMLLSQSPSGSQQLVEKKLENILSMPKWEMTTEQADLLLHRTHPFELRPQVVSTPPPGRVHLLIADTAAVVFPFRDTCFLAIVCAAHASLIWPAGAPDPFRS